MDYLRQLQVWREKGYNPQLHGTTFGWKVVLDSTEWQEPSARSEKEMMRYCTAAYDTPEEAITAALRSVQP